MAAEATKEQPWYVSTTLWFNFLMGVVRLLQGAGVIPPIADDTTYIGTALAGNALLRVKTTKPLDIRKPIAKAIS